MSTSLLAAFLISCYPKTKVLSRWPNGHPRVVRHYRHHDSLNEKLITYYESGKKESISYWCNDYWDYKTMEWYESGAKRLEYIILYKDTSRVFNAADSSYLCTGLMKDHLIEWYENGKLMYERYYQSGQIMDKYNNSKGDSLRLLPKKNIRLDGYDSISFKWSTRKRKH